MRDPPPLLGKRIRYVMVFHFKEAGKPKQSSMRARSWELPTCLEPWVDCPAGWEPVYGTIRRVFARAKDRVVLVVPADTPMARRS